jgi:hypothetical protein
MNVNKNSILIQSFILSMIADLLEWLYCVRCNKFIALWSAIALKCAFSLSHANHVQYACDKLHFIALKGHFIFFVGIHICHWGGRNLGGIPLWYDTLAITQTPHIIYFRDDFPYTSYRDTKLFRCLHVFFPSLYTSPHSVSFFVHISVLILEKKNIFYVTFLLCIVAHVLSVHKSVFYVMS